MKTALLVIDMQQEFYNRGGVFKETYDSAIEYINGAIKLFDSKELPVYMIYHIDEEDGLIPGTEGYEFHKGIKKNRNHKKIDKRYGNAFNKTTLNKDLKEDGVSNLIITGYCAEYCVLSSYRGALDNDFSPALLRGALASGVRNHIKFVEDINEVISYGVMESLITI